MSEVLIVLLVMAGAALLSVTMAYAAIRMARTADRDSFKALLAELSQPVEPPAPAAPPPPPAPAKPVQYTTLKLVSAKGRALGQVTVDARTRRPMFKHTLSNGERSVFQAAEQKDGKWIYRRVGVERD